MDTNKTVLSLKILLTVPQAAKRLGIRQRRLHMLLARPEYAGRTRALTMRTRSGVRWDAPGIPLDLLADLDAALNPVGVQPAPPAPGPAAGTPPPEPGTLPAIVYQKLLDEKDSRIADLKQENQKLHAALLLAQNNLARQQVLRALPPPEAETPSNGHRPGFWSGLRRLFSDDGG